jgi:hypothetical protein
LLARGFETSPLAADHIERAFLKLQLPPFLSVEVILEQAVVVVKVLLVDVDWLYELFLLLWRLGSFLNLYWRWRLLAWGLCLGCRFFDYFWLLLARSPDCPYRLNLGPSTPSLRRRGLSWRRFGGYFLGCWSNTLRLFRF